MERECFNGKFELNDYGADIWRRMFKGARMGFDFRQRTMRTLARLTVGRLWGSR